MPAEPLYALTECEAALDEGRTAEAVALLEAVEKLSPTNPHIQLLLCRAYSASGDAIQAAAAAIAAEALAEPDPLKLYNLATGYKVHGQATLAEKWYRTVLVVDPCLAIAHQNLAAILREKGDFDSARFHLHQAYSLQWIYQENAQTPQARVLVLCAAGLGNVPVEHLFGSRDFTLIKCIVEYAREPERSNLPSHDIVFNAIGDPDCRAAMDERLFDVLDRNKKPLLNRAGSIQRTRRDRIADLLAGVPAAVVPQALRLVLAESDATPLSRRLADKNARYPLILRPAESHGGEGVRLVESPAQADCWEASLPARDHERAIYATAFVDTRGPDPFFRKYRAFFVEARPYPYHLAIADHWMVHYFSAGMTEHAWKREEERRYLADPALAIGEAAWGTVREIGIAMDLDFGGIDFTVRPDGSVVVFEANATMLVHPERTPGPLAHKNQAVDAIVQAFREMVRSRSLREQ